MCYWSKGESVHSCVSYAQLEILLFNRPSFVSMKEELYVCLCNYIAIL